MKASRPIRSEHSPGDRSVLREPRHDRSPVTEQPGIRAHRTGLSGNGGYARQPCGLPLTPETSATPGGRKRGQAGPALAKRAAHRPRRRRRPPVPERPQQRAVVLSGLSKSFARCRRPRRRVMSMPELMTLECDWAETAADVTVATAGPLRAAMAGTGTCPVLAEARAAATGGAAGESGRGGWLASAASGG